MPCTFADCYLLPLPYLLYYLPPPFPSYPRRILPLPPVSPPQWWWVLPLPYPSHCLDAGWFGPCPAPLPGMVVVGWMVRWLVPRLVLPWVIGWIMALPLPRPSHTPTPCPLPHAAVPLLTPTQLCPLPLVLTFGDGGDLPLCLPPCLYL